MLLVYYFYHVWFTNFNFIFLIWGVWRKVKFWWSCYIEFKNCILKKKNMRWKNYFNLIINQYKDFLENVKFFLKNQNPCIICIYGFNLIDETHKLSIILSHEQKSHDSSIKNKELNCEQNNRITVELVLEVHYIHNQKFIHRDLKPVNILLNKNNYAHIIWYIFYNKIKKHLSWFKFYQNIWINSHDSSNEIYEHIVINLLCL